MKMEDNKENTGYIEELYQSKNVEDDYEIEEEIEKPRKKAKGKHF